MNKKVSYILQIIILSLIGILIAACTSQRIEKKSDVLVHDSNSTVLESSQVEESDAQTNKEVLVESKEEAVIPAEKEDKEVSIPSTFKLDIPFSSQAPYGNWALPYQEACEEASMIMAAHYLLDLGEFTPEISNNEILQLIDFQEKNQYKIDITAAETAEVINKYYDGKLSAKTILNPSIDDIKRELLKKNVVIMPFAGRQLDTPFYTQPGPQYHMMVIKGFNQKGFITNDPGTLTKGKDFVFSYKNIMDSFHDWNGGDVANGKKELVVVSKKEN